MTTPYWFNTLATSEGFDPNTEWLGDTTATTGGAGEYLNYGGGMDMGAAPGAAGAPGSSALKQLASRTLPGSFGVQRFMGRGIGAERVPGPFVQSPPRANVGLGSGEETGVPAPLNQAATLRPVTTPTGAERPAGPVVKNNYPSLNGLVNRAQGVYYG